MLDYRTRLLLSAAITCLPLVSPAKAQVEAAGVASEDGDAIVVTGTRAAGRTRLDSVAPVDVLSGDALRRQGTSELAAALSAVTPSIDFPRSAAVDGTDSVRPATLRGLSPDQTLVLINGTRAHPSALLNVNGSVGRGAAAVDLNTIPSVALDRIEVLRDGASAQYGSDAIAGVVNLRLREARSGGGGSVSYGQYVTDVDAALSSRDERDGESVTVSAWQGIALGAEGFLTLSGEYVNRNPTSRGDIDPRATPAVLRSRFGDPDVEQYSFYANAAHPVGDGWEVYGFGGYQHRDSVSAAFPRVPGNVNNVASIYPDGFLPLIGVKSNDLTAAAGLRGELSGWNVDLNVSYGRNKLDFRTFDSLNATYGTNSQTSFDAGALIYDQVVAGLDVSKELPLGDGSLNVAWGWEFRREGYKVEAGEASSYDRGPLGSNASLGSGAQGFPGFQPSNEVEAHRENVGVYLDLEAKLSDRFTIGAAVRGEGYSDFGTLATGKISARYDVTPWLALRGAASTGFRAPSLQQQYFTSTASVFVAPNIVETGTFPSISPIATALGGLPLEPEKSRNFSAGTVIRAGGFDLTVDAYHIRVRNQLGLSENIQNSFSPQVAAILAPYGVSAARFFVNGITSTTRGIDVVGHYRVKTTGVGTFDLTAAANFNDIKVNKVPTSTAVTLSPVPTLFSRQRVISIEQGTPRTKVVGSVDWTLDAFSATARATYYGDVTQPGTTAATDIHSGKKTIFDLETRYQLTPRLGLALGANNLFDTYPDRVPASLNSSGVVAFPYYSPFGFNGRYLYGRINLSW
ncbi:TonB-dependent receptor [Sphingobium aquiterrae]|uniref:TonB-dependent receptor plug domain-containing protein n=1 Tax=Sphingobium aquiterrae TaxID=2038656 RepID=UPI003015F083